MMVCEERQTSCGYNGGEDVGIACVDVVADNASSDWGWTASLSERMLLPSHMQAPWSWAFHPESNLSLCLFVKLNYFASVERSINPVKACG